MPANDHPRPRGIRTLGPEQTRRMRRELQTLFAPDTTIIKQSAPPRLAAAILTDLFASTLPPAANGSSKQPGFQA